MTPQPFSLTGRVAVVTGGASGIGAATVDRLRLAGATVVVADLQPGGADTIATDVRDEEQVAAMLDEVASRHGRLDVLVNNAGVGTTESTEEITADALRLTFAVNVDGVVWGTKHAVRHLGPGGAIVNIASLGADYSLEGYGTYCASKAAVISLTRTAALELGARGIRVNAVCPGVVDTPMLHDPSAAQERMLARSITPLERVARPEDVAAAVHYLASDDAGFVTGEALFVDGGVRTGPARPLVEAVERLDPGYDPAP